jgi:hypothetical protein
MEKGVVRASARFMIHAAHIMSDMDRKSASLSGSKVLLE